MVVFCESIIKLNPYFEFRQAIESMCCAKRNKYTWSDLNVFIL